ncbi:APC family permease [Corynebacterium sp. 335C]
MTERANVTAVPRPGSGPGAVPTPVLVIFQLLVLGGFAAAALWQASKGDGFDPTPVSWQWFSPFDLPDFSTVAAGVSLSIFMFWGWDATLTLNEETKDPHHTPGRASTIVCLVIIAAYVVCALGVIVWAGTGDTGLGAGNPENQESIFAALSGPILGPFAILMSIAILGSSFASLQSTMLSPSRTMLAMGYYEALPPWFSRISRRFRTPSTSTVVSAVAAGAFYSVTRLISENALRDAIAALGLMICFYYGITALACVWYSRRELFVSVRAVVFRLVCPLLGGVSLLVMLAKTTVDSIDPDYGSGNSFLGIGTVFILGVGILLLGVALMLWTRWRHPRFFRGETLASEGSHEDTEGAGV